MFGGEIRRGRGHRDRLPAEVKDASREATLAERLNAARDTVSRGGNPVPRRRKT